MLTTIENAKQSLSKVWIAMGIFNGMAMAIFVLPLFRDLSTNHLFILISAAAGIGLLTGMYLTYRSACGISTALFRLLYGLAVMEIMFGGGAAALTLWIAGRPDLCWLAFYTNCVIAMLSLSIGVYREVSALGLGKEEDGAWRMELKKYIDYANHQLDPAVTATALSPRKNSQAQFPFWLIAIASINIPLLFEAYGGGRNNAMFLAAPVLTSVFAYINLKHGGPGLVRLFLLRKLEKETGRHFVNADYEQIQELRRSFFLSRWLMKDYAVTQPLKHTSKDAIVSRKSK